MGGGWGERQKQTDREKKTERETENRKGLPKRYSDMDRERAGTLKDHRDTQLSLKNVPERQSLHSADLHEFVSGVGGVPDHRPVRVLELQSVEDVAEVLNVSILQELSKDVLKLCLCYPINQVGQVGCTANI